MKYSKIFVALLVLVFVCSVASASVGVKEEGTMLGAATDLNFVGNGITASGATGSKNITIVPTPFEKHDTTDTTLVTAGETGKTWIVTQDTKFQLPTPASGLTYTFVCGGDFELEIQVDTTPTTIKFVSADDGDSSQGVIESASNTTGTTVTLVSDGTDWWVINMAGPSTSGLHFEDGGVWIELDRGAQS